MIGLQVAGPSLPVEPLAAFVFSFSSVCALTLASAATCPARTRRDLRWLLGPLSVLAIVWKSGAVDVWHSAAVLASLLVAGSIVGSIVGASIEHKGHLMFVALVSSLADAASVLHPQGPSAAIVGSEQALSLLAVPFAFPGTSETPALLGVGDVVFAALYVAAARRHGLARRRTLLALTLAFAMTMVVVVGFQVPIPALPFLGLAVLIAHPEARVPPVQDRARGFAVLGALGLALLGIWLSGL